MSKSAPRIQRVLLIGGGAREHAIGEALCRDRQIQLFSVAHNNNPGLDELSHVEIHEEKDVDWITRWATEKQVQLTVIGLEDPLDAGLPDALIAAGIPTVGPIQSAARIETSKLFTRALMKRHSIPGQVDYWYFTDPGELTDFLSAGGEYVLKPLGLTAGKGVKVMGVHLNSVKEAIDYGRRIIRDKIGGADGLLVEERLQGAEFTLQAFVDGTTVRPMPLVQDYKRAFEGDLGPNTGSMGAYSQADGLLPFVRAEARDAALQVIVRIVEALRSEGLLYRGVMYGQFMMTQAGIRLVEINARFGDPEALNVLPLLQTDFVDVCQAIGLGILNDLKPTFLPRATVCKYITPPGYPDHARVDARITLDRKAIESIGVRVYFAKVNRDGDDYLTTTSRSIAFVGVADTVAEAEEAVEEAFLFVRGEFHARHDIGKAELINRATDSVLPHRFVTAKNR